MRIMTWLLMWGMTAALFGGFAFLLLLKHYAQELPDYQALENYDPPHMTRLYSSDGKILEEYAKETRLFAPITSIPLRLRQAFLSAEDRNFYEHPGIDFMGIARAALTNLGNMGSGHALVGGSTITQQVVKNFLLTREQSVDRKIKEAILAFRISNAFSKDKILELYLNQIYLGFNSYGVAASALNYFNKSIDELTIEESAFLAVLPKAPATLNPRRNYKRALDRRNYVIERMRDDGYITSAEAERAKSVPIILRERDKAEFTHAPFFAEEVRRQIVRDYGENVFYEAGLAVHTTLDPAVQKMAEKALLEGLQMYDRRHGYRGPLATIDTNNWLQQLLQVKRPTGTRMWRMAVVLSVSDKEARIGLDNGGKGFLRLDDMVWAKRGGGQAKVAGDVVSKGDVVLVEKWGGDPLLEAQAEKEKEATVSPAAQEENVEETKADEPAGVPSNLVGDTEKGPPVHYELRQIPEVDGALVVMDPHTGRVQALVGGSGFRNIEFNRATQANRQPGSSFKPFIYLAGLERGMNPSSIIQDSPISLPQGAGLPAWSPQNYSNDFYGPITLRYALEKSRNVPTVRLALSMGIKNVSEVAARFGVYDNLPQNYSVVLGSAETTLMRLVNGYAMFVNGGKEVKPVLVDRIADRHGKWIYRSDMRPCPKCKITDESEVSDTVPEFEDLRKQVTDPMTAYQMTSILEGVVRFGTAKRALVLNRPVGGKTGTTNNSIDSWFVGFSPDLVAGVFVGFDRPRTLGAKETGGSVALPIFIDFMQQALADKPATPFRIPPGMRLVRVNHANGQPAGPGVPEDQVILEAFKPIVPKVAADGSTDPVDPYTQPAVLDGGAGVGTAPAVVPSATVPEAAPEYPTEQRQPPRRPATTGTGGLY